jgi:hypothetical protein
LPSGYSAITCKFTYQGTKVFEIESMVVGSTDRVLIHSSTPSQPAEVKEGVLGEGLSSVGSSGQVTPSQSGKINAATLKDDIHGE